MPRIYWPLFWNENNEGHLLESHNVTKQEIEELIFDQDATQKRRIHRSGDAYEIFGETVGGGF